MAEFYETLARAEGRGPTAVRLGQCRTALDLLDQLEEYHARGIATTREPAAELRERLAQCQARLERRQQRKGRTRAGEDSEG